MINNYACIREEEYKDAVNLSEFYAKVLQYDRAKC